MSENSVQGGCACGAIRYEISGNPLVVFNCHCHACQKSTGAAFVSGVVVPEPAFALLRGQPAYYETTGDSGKLLHRGFCAACGTHVTAIADLMPGTIAVHLGSLDEPARFKPNLNVYTDHAMPWFQPGSDTKNYPGTVTG